MKKYISSLAPIIGLIFGLALALAMTSFAGESPWHVLMVLFKSSFGSLYDLGMTLSYTTPLIFTGLSVAVAFHAGLFNIGAEGQLTLGALAMALTGIFLPVLPFPLAPLLAVIVGMLAGGFWGFIPGWLKVKFGSHEVINTIMLNFIAAGIVSWITLDIAADPASQVPMTLPVGEAYFLKSFDPVAKLFPDTPANLSFILALISAVAVWFLIWKTKWGFAIRVTGQNEDAARVAGISVARTRMSAMALAGALAALVGFGEVLCYNGNFRMGFSADYGFVGIAVALLARNSPLGIIFSALLFGALHRGSSNLDLETEKITRDFSYLLQALIILFVSVRALPTWLSSMSFKKGKTHE